MPASFQYFSYESTKKTTEEGGDLKREETGGSAEPFKVTYPSTYASEGGEGDSLDYGDGRFGVSIPSGNCSWTKFVTVRRKRQRK